MGAESGCPTIIGARRRTWRDQLTSEVAVASPNHQLGCKCLKWTTALFFVGQKRLTRIPMTNSHHSGVLEEVAYLTSMPGPQRHAPKSRDTLPCQDATGPYHVGMYAPYTAAPLIGRASLLLGQTS
jgi:hypothetical protein